MARRQKVDITEDQFKRAIDWLENKGTKKGACEILGVSNNKTMETRIQEYQDELIRSARLRKEKRRQPCTPEELVNMIEDYLDGSPFDEMSKRFYRSTAYIKHRLELAGALIRVAGTKNPLRPPLLPEECVLLDEDFRCREKISVEVQKQAEYDKVLAKVISEKGWDKSEVVEVYSRSATFDPKRSIEHKGELVWLPGYQCLAEVINEVPCKDAKAYRVFLLNADRHQYVCVRSWDMGSLRHLVSMGVDVSRMGTFLNGIACKELLNKSLAAARKNKDK